MQCDHAEKIAADTIVIKKHINLILLTSITSFMQGVHLERLYVSSWERSRRFGLREKKPA